MSEKSGVVFVRNLSLHFVTIRHIVYFAAALRGHSTCFVPGLIGMVSLEFNVLGICEIKRRPEVVALLVTSHDHREAAERILSLDGRGFR